MTGFRPAAAPRLPWRAGLAGAAPLAVLAVAASLTADRRGAMATRLIDGSV